MNHCNMDHCFMDHWSSNIVTPLFTVATHVTKDCKMHPKIQKSARFHYHLNTVTTVNSIWEKIYEDLHKMTKSPLSRTLLALNNPHLLMNFSDLNLTVSQTFARWRTDFNCI